MATVGNIKNMHYDIKQRLNRLDSNAYNDLRIPEIDRVLNRAINLYLLLIATPRLRNQLGFETSKRTTDDIKNMVVNGAVLSVTDNIAILPDNYMYYLSTDSLIGTKGSCNNKKLKTVIVQHDDRNEDNVFYNSDFEWGECNIRFFDGGIKLLPSDFTINSGSFKINYIKQHPYVHNAEDFGYGTYTLPDGRELGVEESFVDCELPDITHSEIVDIAVMLVSGDLELPNAYQLKQNQLQIKQILN
jgi:hypothetical protein